MRSIEVGLTCAVIVAWGVGCGGPGNSGNQAGGVDTVPGGDNPYPSVPQNGQLNGDRNFASLLRRLARGQVKRTPWAGYWWPYTQSGISVAAAKYDIARGNSGARSWELAHHGAEVPGVQNWWGHCNGWTAAAVLFPEPRVATLVNGQSFSVADQKALLSEAAMEVNADFFGRREDDPSDFTSPVFEDVYPNQFFLVLTNYVGQGLGLAIDRYTGWQVWNQPVAGYFHETPTRRDYLGSSPGAPNVFRVMMTTKIWWLRDDVEGGHLTEPFTYQDGPSYDSRTLRYEIWLDGPVTFDSAGNIAHSGNVLLMRHGNTTLGGAWHDEGLDPADSHPDYMWIPHSVTASSGFSNPNIDDSWVVKHFASDVLH